MKSEYQKANDAALKKLISQLKGSKEEQLDFLSNERKKRTDELRKEDPKIDIQNHPELDAYGILYQTIANDHDPKVEYVFDEEDVEDDIDTNDNGKIETDELDSFTKDLEDYKDKNPKGRDDIPVTTRR